MLNKYLPSYYDNKKKGVYKNEDMPLLESVFKSLEVSDKYQEFKGITILACQHMLDPQIELFKKFIELGVIPQNILIVPKLYTANREVISELLELGCFVLEPGDFNLSQSFDFHHNISCSCLVNIFDQKYNNRNKVVVIDDGGALTSAVMDSSRIFRKNPEVFSGIEQTNGGKNILLQRDNLPMYITSVASSKEKIEVESDSIVRLILEKMNIYFDTLNISLKILVLGFGAIGSRLVSGLNKAGFMCDVYDSKENKNKPILSQYDVIIGATGSSSLTVRELSLLKKPVHLISVSSSDREFPAAYIRKYSDVGKLIHDTYYYSELGIHLVNGGFPITFDGSRIGCTPLEMDVTMMKILYEFGMLVFGTINHTDSVNYLLKTIES